MIVQANKNCDNGPYRSADDPRIALLKQLVDPVRLRVIDRLAHAGPATVTRLSEELNVPMPQLSNHLRRLREAGLVSGQRQGRQVTYELADPGLERLTPLLDSITGRISHPPQPSASPIASRTCYEHLAGRIGVDLYLALRQQEVVIAQADGTVNLGQRADTLLPQLGVDPALKPRGRQRLAFECLDAIEHAPHLAGALGDALARSFTDNNWIEHDAHSRHFQLTPRGRRRLRDTLAYIDDAQPTR